MVTLLLEELLNERNITRYELAKRAGVQYQVIDNYYKNRVKRYDGYVLDRICEALDCQIQDLLVYRK